MTAKTTKASTTTAVLILSTFALVGLMTTGVVPKAFAQDGSVSDSLTGQFLDDLLGGNDPVTDGNGNGSGSETETETTEQEQRLDETNTQFNTITNEQTGGINQEIGSGEGSEVGSDPDSNAESEADSRTKTRSNDGSTPIPGTSDSNSNSSAGSTSDISNDGTLVQDQTVNNPVQLNANRAGSDRSAEVSTSLDVESEGIPLLSLLS